MQTYYDLGYMQALVKLGMIDKEGRGALRAIKSVATGKGMPLVDPGAQAAQHGAAMSKLQGKIQKGFQSRGTATEAQSAKYQRQMERINQRYGVETPMASQAPASAGASARAGTPAQAGAPASTPMAAKAEPPIAQSASTPAAAAAPAGTKEAPQGFFSRYKWPIGLGVGAAGLGAGYLALRSRDRMGQYPVQGY